ncbi:MAG: hypothetical protein QMB52_02860 [Propionivibrio sp.]
MNCPMVLTRGASWSAQYQLTMTRSPSQRIAQLLDQSNDHVEFAKVREFDTISSKIAGGMALVPTGAKFKGIVA